MSDELPRGWASTSLAELLTTLESGSRPRGGVRGIAEGVPSIGGEHLNYTGGFNFDSVKYVPKDFAVGMKKGRIQRDDILVVKDGATTGKTAFVNSDFPFDEAFVNEHVFICRPAKEIEPQFLFRFLTSMDGQKRILENFKGSAQGGINQTFAPNTEVPLAPLGEQRRIVAKLEKLLGKVDACQHRLAKIPVLLKRFRQSVLAAACSGRLTADWREENSNQVAPASLLDELGRRRKELWAAQRKAKGLAAKPPDYPEPAQPSDEFEFDVPESWERCSMDALTSVITSGSRDWKQYYRDNGSGTFIMAQNVRPLWFDRSYRLAVAPPENDRDRARSEVFKDDLLVTIVGANTGDSCRVPEKLRELYVCQSVALMRPVLPETSRFLELFLNSTGHGLAEFRKWIYGEGRPHLSFDNLRETLVCLPPLAEQLEIVRRVEGLFALSDQIEAWLAQARAQVDKLTPSLLARAFRGHLVPQNPTDEPAGKLLEKIKSTRK